MNEWQILLSKESLKFLRKNHLPDSKATEAVVIAIKKLAGEDINVDLKKLNPPYEGYFRIRVGRIRITVEIDFRARRADVADIKWRGGAYR